MLKKLFIYLLLPALVAGFYVATNLPRIYTRGINYDEIIYIRRTQLYEKFIFADFNSSIWQSWDALDQPPIAPYIYGLALTDYAGEAGGYAPLLHQANLLGGYHPCQPTTVQPGADYTHYDYWQCIDGKSPTEFPAELSLAKQLIFRTRTVAVIATGLTLGVTVVIGTILIHPLMGLMAATLVGWLSLFGTLGVMGMIDPILYFWYSLCLLLMVTHKKFWWIGIAIGLAISTKFNAGSLLIAYSLAHLKQWRSVIITAIIAAAVFIFVNPYLWSNPIGNTIEMVKSRQYAYTNQRQANPKHQLNTQAERFQAIRGNFSTLILICLSLGILASIAIPKLRLLGLITLIELGALLIYLPLNWDRYYLPLFIPVSLIACAGVYSLPTLIKWSIERLKMIIGGLVILLVVTHLPELTLFEWVITISTTLLLVQGMITAIAMSWAWLNDSSNQESTPNCATQLSFSLLVPAKYESSVIGDTIAAIDRLNYPRSLYEALILIPAYDFETILAANRAIEKSTASIRVIELDGDTNTKAYSLNIGLHFASHQIVGVFDAEDEPQPNILTRISNEFGNNPTIQAVQASVQLTNLTSRWFSTINALEYYFWFKSVLPFLAQFNAGLTAGNTVFFKRNTLAHMGGWDETCLTEDAELGVRFNQANLPVKFIFDPAISTLEETPMDEFAFIKQRSRWDHGFLQVINRKDWLLTQTLQQKFLIGYTLIQPIFRHLAVLNMLVTPIVIHQFAPNTNVVVALFSWLPSYFVLYQLTLYIYGYFKMTKDYHLKSSRLAAMTIPFLFYPYQILLVLGSFRGIINTTKQNLIWDKTQHYNLHRSS